METKIDDFPDPVRPIIPIFSPFRISNLFEEIQKKVMQMEPDLCQIAQDSVLSFKSGLMYWYRRVPHRSHWGLEIGGKNSEFCKISLRCNFLQRSLGTPAVLQDPTP